MLPVAACFQRHNDCIAQSALQQALLASIAVLAVLALTTLGGAMSENVVGLSRGGVSTPQVGSRAVAFSFAGAASKVGQAVRKLRDLPAEGAAMVAAEYGISETAVRALAQSRAARKRAARAPLHRGEVLFTAPSGGTFKLHRPVYQASEGEALWALVDVDNVIADFSGGFGDEAHRLTGADRTTFPRNNSNYDMREAVGLTQSLLASDEPLPPTLRTFERWLLEQGQREAFLVRPPTSHENYSLLHRYFIEQGFYTRIEPLPGARDGMAALWSKWPVRVVTKRFGSGPDFSHVSPRVPVDSAAWIADAIGDAYDSLAIMGGAKIDYAGNVFAVLEDSVQNIADIRTANASAALRERAFVEGVRPADLNGFLARNNADVLGVVFRWNYNKGDALLGAPNIVAVDSWADAVAVSLAHRKLLTDPEAGRGGRLHWQDVHGLVNTDGNALSLPEARFASQ